MRVRKHPRAPEEEEKDDGRGQPFRERDEGITKVIHKEITISGGNDEGVPPVPIPNTEVKPFSADGT